MLYRFKTGARSERQRRFTGMYQCRHLVIVSNEVFEGGTNYDPSTVRYLDILGKINREIAKMADAAAEITAGCWIWHKQGGKIQ